VDEVKKKLKLRRRKLAKQERNRIIVHKAKDVPCFDCGVKYPFYVMQFDHRPDTTKTKDKKGYRALGGVYYRSGGTSRLLIEIVKCDVVCANCNHIRTYVREYGNG
jgi:hypothetical protein